MLTWPLQTQSFSLVRQASVALRSYLVDLLFGFVAGSAIALVDFAGAVNASANNRIKVVYGQLAPVRFGPTGCRYPVILDTGAR